MLKKSIVKELKTLGVVEDVSHSIPIYVKETILYTFNFQFNDENKDLSEILKILYYKRGYFSVKNPLCPLKIYLNKEIELFEESFRETDFRVLISKKNKEISVDGFARDIYELKEVLSDYQKAINHFFNSRYHLVLSNEELKIKTNILVDQFFNVLKSKGHVKPSNFIQMMNLNKQEIEFVRPYLENTYNYYQKNTSLYDSNLVETDG